MRIRGSGALRRWLAEDAFRPWQYQSWIFIADLNFAAKAARVLDLYSRVWDGKPLSANDYVVSADERTSIQARCQCHPWLPPGKAPMTPATHDDHRGGALAHLAAIEQRRTRFEVRYNTAAKPSDGSSPPTISPTSWNDSTHTKKPRPRAAPNQRQPDPRRTYKPDH